MANIKNVRKMVFEVIGRNEDLFNKIARNYKFITQDEQLEILNYAVTTYGEDIDTSEFNSKELLDDLLEDEKTLKNYLERL